MTGHGTDTGADTGADTGLDLDALAEAYERGLTAEKAGDTGAATAAYRDCLALDPEDRGGVAVRLATLGAAPTPDRAPPAYVATLFDQHADSFEMTLVHSLGYAIPDVIAEAIDRAGLLPSGGRFARALDLGCGTGLVGEAMEDMVAVIEGVDLAEEMIAIADEKEIYASFVVGDAEAACRAADQAAYDLIVAADVLPYLGTVDGLFGAVAHALAPGGVFAFSTETLPEAAFGDAAYCVGPAHRFAHRAEAVKQALTIAGLEVRNVEPAVIRYETGVPVPGHVCLAMRRVLAGA